MAEGVTFRRGNWCYGCGATDTEPAGGKCKNPAWHTPSAIEAAEANERERRDAEVRLPYAEEQD